MEKSQGCGVESQAVVPVSPFHGGADENVYYGLKFDTDDPAKLIQFVDQLPFFLSVQGKPAYASGRLKVSSPLSPALSRLDVGSQCDN